MISWYQPTQDFRPLSFPPNKNILGWWKTGENTSNESTLVAIVNAVSFKDAEKIIRKDWPEVTNWMIERINNFNGNNDETIQKI